MCYHVYMRTRRLLGVRAMRQNLSVYLRRVRSGETFQVTARGRPVALLTPIQDELTPIGRLVASGRASRPEGDLLELGPPPKGDRSRRLSQALQEQPAVSESSLLYPDSSALVKLVVAEPETPR